MAIVRVSQALLDLLRSRAIFQNLNGSDRWPLGERIGFDANCRIEPYGQILSGQVLPRALGAFSYSRCDLPQDVQIGRYCSLARTISWMGEGHPTAWASTSPAFYESASAALQTFRINGGGDYALETFEPPNGGVEIGSDVWIGDEAMIAPGVRIGHGAVIGARALVLRDVEPYAIMVGAPARLLRYRIAEELIPRFLDLAWWRFSPDFVSTAPVSDPQRFIDQLAENLARTQRKPMAPVVLTGREIIDAADPD
jgi:acetyltransferase-like isoleucine patch superfamily enzyme